MNELGSGSSSFQISLYSTTPQGIPQKTLPFFEVHCLQFSVLKAQVFFFLYQLQLIPKMAFMI